MKKNHKVTLGRNLVFITKAHKNLTKSPAQCQASNPRNYPQTCAELVLKGCKFLGGAHRVCKDETLSPQEPGERWLSGGCQMLPAQRRILPEPLSSSSLGSAGVSLKQLLRQLSFAPLARTSMRSTSRRKVVQH